MNAHVPEPAVPLDVADLEDLVCRVHWMSAIAWEYQSGLSSTPHPDDRVKLDHLIRATHELALELYGDFYKVLEGCGRAK